MADNVLEPQTFSFGDAKSASPRMQFKGLGVPNKYFAMQKKQMYIRLHCLLVLWTPSMCFPNLKITLQSSPSVFKFNLKRTVIFLHKNFRICNRRKQGNPVPPRNFWIWFYKSDFKNDCWASPKPDIQHKNALVSHLNDRWISKFLEEKSVFEKSSLIYSILYKSGSIPSGFSLKFS